MVANLDSVRKIPKRSKARQSKTPIKKDLRGSADSRDRQNGARLNDYSSTTKKSPGPFFNLIIYISVILVLILGVVSIKSNIGQIRHGPRSEEGQTLTDIKESISDFLGSTSKSIDEAKTGFEEYVAKEKAETKINENSIKELAEKLNLELNTSTPTLTQTSTEEIIE